VTEEAPPSADAEFVDTLVQLSFAVHGIITDVAAAHDMSVIQARLLGVLRDREPPMAELARFLRLDKSSLTGLVDRAERRGLVERVASPADGRSVLVRLTPDGGELALTAAAEIRQRVRSLARGLTDGERRRLTALAGHLLS
jgi:MarR family transcriptional regulator, lower aerobic nicotinate degradation pathway regulator